MRWIQVCAAGTALLVPAANAPANAAPEAGQAFAVTLTRNSEQRSEGSEGSTHDRDTVVERVMAVGPGGVELEYDLPSAASAEDRESQWQLPVRLLKPADGPPRLLNPGELEARRDAWLRRGGMTRAACGHWIFTWNAFRIECDPHSVLVSLRRFDLGDAELKQGDAYSDEAARAPGRLTRTDAGYRVRLEVDPDAVRRHRAETDVAVAEISGKPTTLEAALAERAKESVSGTIEITLETGASGEVRRRSRVTKVEIRRADGTLETDTVTEIVERRPLAAAPPVRDTI